MDPWLHVVYVKLWPQCLKSKLFWPSNQVLAHPSAQQYCSRLGLEGQVSRLQDVLVVTIWEEQICELEKERKF